ncbi:MAG: hypothetical protein PHE89_03800 [Alphaproteobacteria bacterium]|nr:hypothetical protein [Alphaproteobacteria bacterium]
MTEKEKKKGPKEMRFERESKALLKNVAKRKKQLEERQKNQKKQESEKE